MKRKILLLAGEESGMMYARKLMAEPALAGFEFRTYADSGFETADLAVFGFYAVFKKLFFFLRVKRTIERVIDTWQPDVVCTIDYPGMNLALAAYAHARGIRTVHVVCPQVWAWKRGRIPKIEAALDRLCCFFPFEPAMFRPGLASFVGHPLVDEFVSLSRRQHGEERPLVALLPGSRVGEIERCLPTMLAALKLLKVGLRAVIPAANARVRDMIGAIVKTAKLPAAVELDVREGGARELLLAADCAVVASGTATLEAALARCPTVLVYRVSYFLAKFARCVIREIRHVGLINVVWEKSGGTGEEPMPELLQEAFTPKAVADIVGHWLEDGSARRAVSDRLDATVRLLGSSEGAMRQIAQELAGT